MFQREVPNGASRPLFRFPGRASTFEWGVLFEFVFTRLSWMKARVGYIANNWIYTTNHKRIAFNYFGFVIFSGIVGMVLATIIRAELAYPGFGILAGDNAQYLSVVTAHAVVMVFFMIMPLLFGAFANFLLPTQLGVHDVAFPRLNSAAFWFLPAGFLMLCQIACTDRRYNRMNAFSVRDAEILLKSKYFRNLVSMFDHHWFLESTALGVRFKTNYAHNLNHDLLVTLNHGVVKAPTSRSVRFLGHFSNDQSLMPHFPTTSWSFRFFEALSTSRLAAMDEPVLWSLRSAFSWNTNTLVEIAEEISTWVRRSFHAISGFFGGEIEAVQAAFTLNRSLNESSSLDESLSSYDIVDYFDWLAEFFFVRFSTSLIWLNDFCSSVFSVELNGNKFFTVFDNMSTYYTSLSVEDNLLGMYNERSDSYRGNEHLYGAEPYVLKVGNYWPRALAEQHFKARFSTFDDRFREDGRSAWARSFMWNTLFEGSWNQYNKLSLDLMPASRNLDSGPWLATTTGVGAKWRLSNHTFGFYNFMSKLYSQFPVNRKLWDNEFHTVRENSLQNRYPSELGAMDDHLRWEYVDGWHAEYLKHSVVSMRWVAVSAVQRKFHNMFITQSYQQRISSNWRELQFTREAWRCRLLATRNQKSLYKRWGTNKDRVVLVDRLATDLLPGWAMITPFSARTKYTAIGKVDLGLMGVFLVLNSSIVSSANFLVTYRYLSTLNNRKMRDARSFFTEGIMVASWMMIAANPMLAIGILMLLSDRHWQTSFFDYSGGGDTVLFQHMFWFFGHPEVYVIMIPAFGFNNTLLSFYLRKRVSARASLMYSMYTIAFLGFFVWGHHMYMVGLAHTTRMLFSTLTVMISVPAATKLMHWCVTLVNSAFWVELPFLFTLLFIFFFVSGGISGMAVAHTGMDILFHDSFYVVGHFHVMFAGAAMFASFGAFYFYFPSIVGVKFSRLWGYIHLGYFTLGQLMTVIPMFWLGYAGMPRRIIDYPAALGGWHAIVSGGHMITVASLISFFIMIFDSMRQGRAAVRTSFGVSRFNTRLNFYLYEVARTLQTQRSGWGLYRYSTAAALSRSVNYETLELPHVSYAFIR